MVVFTKHLNEAKTKQVALGGKKFLTTEGFIKSGWGLVDYLKHALEREFFECVVIWGQPGSGKSNFARQILYGIYRDWGKVLKYTVTSIEEMLEVVKEWQNGAERPYAIILDDISRVLPRQLWQENKQLYIAFSKALQVIRSLFRVIIVTVPDVGFLPEPILAMQTFDVHVTPKHNYYANRIIKTYNYFKRNKTFVRKILVEVGSFDLSREPYDVFQEYVKRRNKMAFDAMALVEQAMSLGRPKAKETGKEAEVKREVKKYTLTCIKCGHIWKYRPVREDVENVICPRCRTRQLFFMAAGLEAAATA